MIIKVKRCNFKRKHNSLMCKRTKKRLYRTKVDERIYQLIENFGDFSILLLHHKNHQVVILYV